MHHSARNQMHGTVTAVSHDETMSTVKAVLGDGQTMTAGITTDSVEDLDLASGDSVMMVIKSTQVMVAKLS
jgi:molybdate transport system regulatory protein